jgi:protein gp37
MAENSKIEWTDHTFNPVRGCTKISDGCKNCYAEKLSLRNPATLGEWGPNGKRSIAVESYWRAPVKWNRIAKEGGQRRRVFCASLSDVFEDHPDWIAPRKRLFRLITDTPDLDWLLLTKRPENISRLIYQSLDYSDDPDWSEMGEPHGLDAFSFDELYPNVWLGVSVENQEQADKRIPYLLKVPAAVRFLSCEPLLGPVNFVRHCIEAKLAACEKVEPNQLVRMGLNRQLPSFPWIDWVICGGESGPGARPMHPDWARSLRDQCEAAGVAFHFKQWGEWVPTEVATLAEIEDTGAFPVQVGDIDLRSDGLITGKVSAVRSATNPRRDGLPVGIVYQHWIDRDERLGHEQTMRRIGKKAAGRRFDGVEWNQLPQIKA